MPFLARCWAELMPGTHLNRIFVNEFLRGANAGGTWSEIGFMAALGMLLFWWGPGDMPVGRKKNHTGGPAYDFTVYNTGTESIV